VDQFTIRSDWSPFTKGLTNFTMVKMSKFIQNLMKPTMNLDTFWCSVSTKTFHLNSKGDGLLTMEWIISIFKMRIPVI